MRVLDMIVKIPEKIVIATERFFEYSFMLYLSQGNKNYESQSDLQSGYNLKKKKTA